MASFHFLLQNQGSLEEVITITARLKSLVIQGEARFGFRHITSDKTHEITSTSKELKIVETVPGWSHDITNIGSEDMIVMLWANEIFDSDNPDTIKHQV